MKKKVVKIFLISMFMIITLVQPLAFAVDTGLGDLDAYGGGSSGESTKLKGITEQILGIIQVVGTVVAVVMLIVIGIKYMTGSIEEKAEYKQTLKPYLIGAFLLFSGSTVPQIIYQISKNF